MQKTSIGLTIRDLEAQIDKIQAAIASLKAVDGTFSSATKPHKGKRGPRQTIIGAVLAHLKKKGVKQTNQEIRAALMKAGVKASNGSILTTISKRAKQKIDIVNKGRGMWGLK